MIVLKGHESPVRKVVLCIGCHVGKQGHGHNLDGILLWLIESDFINISQSFEVIFVSFLLSNEKKFTNEI